MAKNRYNCLASFDDGKTSDYELLTRYLKNRDEADFATIVKRLWRMVHGVCSSYLHNPQDAEDASQAAFVVLSRRGNKLKKPASFHSFLFGIAVRAAKKVREMNGRIRRAESRAESPKPQPDHAVSLESKEASAILCEEINGLPEKYRAPVVLCDLQGKSRKEAAAVLGIPEGTLASRLDRGRKRLTKRLTTRGVTVGLVALVKLVTEQTPVGGHLLPAKIVAAVSSPTPRVSAIADAVMRTMLSKLGVYTAWAAATVLLGAGVVTAAVLASQPDRTVPPSPRGEYSASSSHTEPPEPAKVPRPAIETKVAKALPGSIELPKGVFPTALAVSPSGIVAVGDGRSQGSSLGVLLFDSTGKEVRRVPLPDGYGRLLGVRHLAFCPHDPSLLAVGTDGVHILNTEGRDEKGDWLRVAAAIGTTRPVAFAEGELLFGGTELCAYDVKNKTTRVIAKGGGCDRIEVSPTKRHVLDRIFSGHGAVYWRRFELTSGKPVPLPDAVARADEVRYVEGSNDELVSLDKAPRATLRCWDAADHMYKPIDTPVGNYHRRFLSASSRGSTALVAAGGKLGVVYADLVSGSTHSHGDCLPHDNFGVLSLAVSEGYAVLGAVNGFTNDEAVLVVIDRRKSLPISVSP